MRDLLLKTHDWKGIRALKPLDPPPRAWIRSYSTWTGTQRRPPDPRWTASITLTPWSILSCSSVDQRLGSFTRRGMQRSNNSCTPAIWRSRVFIPRPTPVNDSTQGYRDGDHCWSSAQNAMSGMVVTSYEFQVLNDTGCLIPAIGRGWLWPRPHAVHREPMKSDEKSTEHESTHGRTPTTRSTTRQTPVAGWWAPSAGGSVFPRRGSTAMEGPHFSPQFLFPQRW
jgi:hypothetical protein